MQQFQPRVKFTDNMIASTLPQEKVFVLIDTEVPGLQCFINPRGKKSFKLRVRGFQKEIGQFPFTKCADARKTALIWRGDLLKGKKPKEQEEATPEIRDISVDDLIGEYLQYKQSGNNALEKGTFYAYSFVWKKHLSPALGKKMISQLTDVDVNGFFISVNKTYSVIKTSRVLLQPALNYAEVLGYDISHLRPAKWLKVKGRKKERYFTPGELSRLQSVLSQNKQGSEPRLWQFDVLELLMLTGCRCSEILELRWQDVFLEEGYLQLWETKTRKGRRIPIVSPMDELIRKIFRTNNPYVFRSNRRSDQPMGYTALENFWLLLEKKLAINNHDSERLTIHSLRHTYITAANNIDISPWTIAALVGHSVGGSITGLYIHHNLNKLKKAQEQIVYTLNNGSY